MRKYFLWFGLLVKRMLKKKAFVFFLLILPFLSVLITRLELNSTGDGKDDAGITVGIFREEVLRGDGKQAAVTDEAWMQRFEELLSVQDGTVKFHIYEKQSDFLQDIASGKADCGAVIPADMQELIMSDTWQESVTLYHTSSSSMTEIVKERIAAVIFTLYAEKSYVNYINDSDAFQAAEENGSIREEIAAFAKEAYETHLLDGSTFAFSYHGDDFAGQSASLQTVSSMFRLKGILAVCIFLSGMCGLLTDWNDRREKRFVRIAPTWMTTMVNIWIPTIFTSIAALFSLILAKQLSGIGGIAKELCHLVFYQFLIVVYCSIIRLIVRRQELAAAAIPILTLACMICCPVWIRLALYLPAFRVLEKLFPVTYYLLL